MLSEADQTRVAEAVRAAEARTTGEVLCVLTNQVSHYRETPLAAGIVFALAMPPAALAIGLRPGAFLTRAEEAWTSVHGLTEADVGLALGAYALVQTALFVLGAGIALIPPVRRFLTPRSLKRHRVRRAARAQFAGAGFHEAEGKPGVVIFASADDRMVEVMASETLHRAVDPGLWDAAVAAVVSGMASRKPADGFISAIALCGEALRTHFPGAEDDANRHTDRVVEY
jgi:putative membrane protein